VRPNRTRP
jgi:Trypsin